MATDTASRSSRPRLTGLCRTTTASCSSSRCRRGLIMVTRFRTRMFMGIRVRSRTGARH
uniref:Uncharacterized protein n=1 Tax=Arundo donax TaxID=35708 RepID=A0A0A9EJG3_ARUDO